ncbi:hypothetical protein IFT36_06960 [Frigoribacterium sp. CFBP 13605]|uniref:hypothetical protein n=1 Tax=Frigoribacterium sp. CFBP 13605 TaxID=2774034 RepID=UPI001902D1A4|nr:hypothetical protein [Frigoribacterium sp. CFBP 13605]MBD8140285.1 hypothetical protein [Frigoribacterium sp. CFBP 13605]
MTVTFPESASTDALADRIAADVLANFWECDHDHVRVAVTSSTRPARPSGARPPASDRARGQPLALPKS